MSVHPEALRERERAVAWLDAWADIPEGTDPSYSAGWRMCAFNAAREIERGDHLPRLSASGIPLTRNLA